MDTNKADNTLSKNETEPATKHDVKEGGIIGAVGGAVVGAIAAGPLAPVGAVIGAIAGGAGSAAAVDVVDKHDHDYDKTVGRTDDAI
ncbi:MAG: hypothetical protein ACRYFS_20510 [Janthinobacterium lividum]